MFTVIYHNVEVQFNVVKVSNLFPDEPDHYSYEIVDHPYVSGGLAVYGWENFGQLIEDMKQTIDSQLCSAEDPHLHLDTVYFFSHSEPSDEEF